MLMALLRMSKMGEEGESDASARYVMHFQKGKILQNFLT